MPSYEQFRKHQADFYVRYSLYAASEGGREITFQHLRCDFMYEGDDPQKDGIFIIHPEFLDEAGAPIDEGAVVPIDGIASMWFASQELRASVHRSRIQVGVCGYFMEGSRRVGKVEVTRIGSLFENNAV